ncbi:hypothetical protein B0T25DRAFT_594637 [Lasiosphaeria hispida]|uniref:Nudix hydrolase domain-containing protein n=1 Tax=Lasiosphaeria hispida TaxID=260671 RepID=A0AAJ0H4N4_9PEZI|nr:hypothetical protein B0T25DRAFT_594637 [Lasiosphaeria hispida]
MSCGTVTLDLARGMVLLIWNKALQIHQLPKGRRNIDEPMLNAAVRETYEETGNPQVTEGRPSTEFLGACLYPDPQSDTKALKAVFYFVATADSTTIPASGTQEAHEKLDTTWCPIAEATTKLRFQGEIAAVLKAVEDVKKTGYTIGG